MHELTVTKQLLDLALKHASTAEASQVTELNVVVGDLSSFAEDAVRFCWDLVSRGTICEGAALRLRRIPAELTCLDCGGTHTLVGELVPCPYCQSAHLRVTAGDDLLLESIDVETRDPVMEGAL
jgi:hydrogenase nickel incorporation protein HypA/HybF